MHRQPKTTTYRIVLVFMLLSGLWAGANLSFPSARLEASVHAAPLGQSTSAPALLNIVISEFRTRGPAGGSDEFIELFNPTADAIQIGGWLIRGSSSSGTVTTRFTFPAGTTLQPGQYYLLAGSAYSGAVTPDGTYASGIADDGGVALTLGNAPTYTVIDRVGLSAGSFYSEGTTIAPQTINENRSYERLPGGSSGGCIDGDNNAADFVSISPSSPQNSSSPFTVCLNAVTNTPTNTATETNTPTATATATATATPTVTLTPVAPLTVLINEVAWAGTVASADDEWIELYNPGAVPISLDGWRLAAADGAPDITLTGTIAAGGFYLLERGDDNTVRDAVAAMIFSGSLSNDGETLRLYAPGGLVIDTANITGGRWPAGLASPNFASMERRAVMADIPNAWITNTGVVRNGLDANNNPINGTPGRQNWALSVTPTATTTATLTRTPTPTRTPTRTPTPMPGILVINEFLPFPRQDWNRDGVLNFGDEFIEIMNAGTEPVNLRGWRLDDVDGQSAPYILPTLTLLPGQKAVFFASLTNLQLSNGGDSVRLLRTNGQVADHINFPVVLEPDKTWCRIPDGKGVWIFGCLPTIRMANSTTSGTTLPPPIGDEPGKPPVCPPDGQDPLSKAECDLSGVNTANVAAWKEFFLGDRIPIDLGRSKWDQFGD